MVCLLRNNMKLSSQGVVAGSASVKVDDKLSFMAKALPSSNLGAADSAWDD